MRSLETVTEIPSPVGRLFTLALATLPAKRDEPDSLADLMSARSTRFHLPVYGPLDQSRAAPSQITTCGLPDGPRRARVGVWEEWPIHGLAPRGLLNTGVACLTEQHKALLEWSQTTVDFIILLLINVYLDRARREFVAAFYWHS
ncbi:MAG: hypothetical protein Q9159_000090 [Coniocarpon cinnabarinum]